MPLRSGGHGGRIDRVPARRAKAEAAGFLDVLDDAFRVQPLADSVAGRGCPKVARRSRLCLQAQIDAVPIRTGDAGGEHRRGAGLCQALRAWPGEVCRRMISM